MLYFRQVNDGDQPGQPRLLRQLNDRATLTLLLERGPMSRNEIAGLTGLSKPTASEIIRRLSDAGVITTNESRAPSPRGGPHAVLYTVDAQTVGVAVDVQSDVIRSTVVDVFGGDHALVAHRLTRAESRADAAEVIADAITRAVEADGVDASSVGATMVGVQASVDKASDTLAFTDLPTTWPRENVTGVLSRALGIHVGLENDANLAAVAERRAGAGHTSVSFALFWIAQGVGASLDFGGRIHRGAFGAAGETAYLPIPRGSFDHEPNAEKLGDLIGQTALIRLAREYDLIEREHSSATRAWLAMLEQLPGLGQHHPMLLAVAERLAQNILPTLAVADPEIVIAHGPVGIAGGDALAEATTAWLRKNTGWCTRVAAPEVTVAPSLRGAGYVLIDSMREGLIARSTG